MSPAEIRRRDVFPYKALPHPAQGGGLGGQVFPQMQIKMFPRLERYDVEFDLPEAFLPEFPPAMYLQSRPELGDVSRGEVVSINNYYRLFKDLLTPVQLDGLRLLVTPFPQEEFNPTDDRKTAEPSLGVTCFDCHVNGHTTGQFHINPDTRPEQRRIAPGHGEPARPVQPADSRVEAEPALGRGLHRVRAADGLLQRRRDPCHQEGDEHPGPHPGDAHGPDAEHARFPAGAQADRHWAASTRRRRPRASCAARSCSSARPSARSAIRRRSTSTTRCTTCTWSGS